MGDYHKVSDIRARSLLEAARIALAGGLDELLLWVPADGVPVPHQNSSKSEHAPVLPPMSDVVHDQDCTVQLPAAKALRSCKMVDGGPCQHCGVTATPQWRRPKGTSKQLCNACGIYFTRYNRLPEKKAQCPTEEAAYTAAFTLEAISSDGEAVAGTASLHKRGAHSGVSDDTVDGMAGEEQPQSHLPKRPKLAEADVIPSADYELAARQLTAPIPNINAPAPILAAPSDAPAPSASHSPPPYWSGSSNVAPSVSSHGLQHRPPSAPPLPLPRVPAHGALALLQAMADSLATAAAAQHQTGAPPSMQHVPLFSLPFPSATTHAPVAASHALGSISRSGSGTSTLADSLYGSLLPGPLPVGMGTEYAGPSADCSITTTDIGHMQTDGYALPLAAVQQAACAFLQSMNSASALMPSAPELFTLIRPCASKGPSRSRLAAAAAHSRS